jgi:nucleoid-associated protein YgaU
MEQLTQARLYVEWANPPQERKKLDIIPVQYNPTELTWDKSAQIAEITIPGLDAPLQQFIRGQAEKLTLELFFDSTDKGMGKNAVSVTADTDLIYRLIKIEPETHAPPICTFFWNKNLPGSYTNGETDSPEGQNSGAASKSPADNQARNGFKCIVESVKQKFTMFSPEGVPLRATLTVTLREYKKLEDQIAHINPTSPDRTHSHVLQRGETLATVAGRFYRHPGDWRFIAEANGIEDPRRLTVGSFLTIPPTR